MQTHFAPAERATAEDLARQVRQVSDHAIVSGLLHSISGVLAILNEQRQVVAVNEEFLRMTGIEDAQTQLGLRPGESLHCKFADNEPGGCGTSRACPSCGAAIAIVSSLERNSTEEEECTVSCERGGQHSDIALRVRSHPIDIDGSRYLMLFLQDITLPQKRAALERTFFHDINNLLSVLLGSGQLLTFKHPSPLADRVFSTAQRLHQEVVIQKTLMLNDSCCYQPQWQELPVGSIFDDLKEFFTGHAVARERSLQIEPEHADRLLRTDRAVLLRVLSNMLLNAFEASEPGEQVRLWVKEGSGGIAFCVWNAAEIPGALRMRIFQRNFSTKAESGRGIGTYSMKLFGEEVLGGKVSFASSAGEGTLFQICLAG